MLPRPGLLDAGLAVADQGLKFGFIDRNVSGFIRAIETMNKVNILASPRVLVLNKQRAEIQIGQRLGYRNTVTNLTSSLQTVQFLSVGTLLNLRPFISQDGMIRMEIHPEKSTGTLDLNGIPQTNTSEMTTNILVPDGATIVIGGLIDSSDSTNQSGVLGLSRLPGIGPFFRDRTNRATKTELIVLLTPRILNRSSLPEPTPGMPPKGPSGIPNTGAMPGPALMELRSEATEASADPVARLRRLTSEPPKSVFSAMELPKTPLTEADLPPLPPPRDNAVRQSSMVVANPEPSSVLTPKSNGRNKMQPNISVPAPYRPGDITRSTIEKLKQGLGRPSGNGKKPPAVPPPVSGSQTDRLGEMPSPVANSLSQSGTVDQRVVRVGDTFGSIAQEVYGSASLRGVLWAVNRHTISSPDNLEPGQTIMLPPPAVLDRMILDAAVAGHAPPTTPPEPRRSRLGNSRFFSGGNAQRSQSISK